jgi:hypothetical protein
MKCEFSKQSILKCINPRLIHKLPLHDENIGFWCVVTARRITGPNFHDDTVNVAQNVNIILNKFFAELTGGCIRCFPAGFSNSSYSVFSLEALRDVLGDHIITCGL